MDGYDFDKIERVFRQYYKPLRAFAFRMVSDADAAEDIVQDVFAALCFDPNLLHAERDAKPYLMKAVYNRSLNYLSSKHYTHEQSLERLVDQINVEWVQQSNQQHLFMLHELQTEVARFTAQLPPQTQRVFVFSRTEGLTIPEIAARMNLSHKTVEKYLCKALADLRIHLKERGLLSLLLLLYFHGKIF